jgi:hypothetical protein
VEEPNPVMMALIDQGSEMKSLVEKLVTDDKENEDIDINRNLIVEIVKVKIRRISDARLDDFQEDLERMMKYYIKNPDSGPKYLEDY